MGIYGVMAVALLAAVGGVAFVEGVIQFLEGKGLAGASFAVLGVVGVFGPAALLWAAGVFDKPLPVVREVKVACSKAGEIQTARKRITDRITEALKTSTDCPKAWADRDSAGKGLPAPVAVPEGLKPHLMKGKSDG